MNEAPSLEAHRRSVGGLMSAASGRRLVTLSSLFLVFTAAAALAQPPAPATPATPPPAATEGMAATTAAPRDYMAEMRAAFTPESKQYSDIKTGLRFLSPFYGVAA